MSRIGKKPLVIPEKVKLEVKGSQVEISGPLGKLTQNIPNGLQVSITGTTALVELKNGVSKDEAGHLHGLTRTIIQNSIQGVTQGFKRDLFVVGLGYRGQVTGDKLTLTLGFSHPVEFKIPQGIKAVVVDAKQTVGGVPAFTLTLSGTDKI
jgi:large subunit ribosomal protein L6